MSAQNDTSLDNLGRSYRGLLHDDGNGPGADPEIMGTPTEMRTDEARDLGVTEPTPLRIIEAMLFVGPASTGLSAGEAQEAIRGLTSEQFSEAIDSLNSRYRRQGRPYAVEKQGDGHVLRLRSQYRHIIDKLFGCVREARLTQPAIDVLAIIAYRQPVTRQEVENVRGHDSSALLRQLVRRGLVMMVSRAEAGGREVQYGTTPRFLKLFGLQSLDDLPQTEDLQRL